ncbi:hypothetical protein ACNOYE_36510 [Nannocystaceae bacterium ST9]
MRLEVDALTRVVRAALPEATPDVIASTLLAQIPHVDLQRGIELVDRVTAKLPASTWHFDDACLDCWPELVAERSMVHVRALAPGTQRILALCRNAKRLTLDERSEALAGILDGTLPATTWEYGKPMSYGSVIAGLIRTLPEEHQEAWIVRESVDDEGKHDPFGEYLTRRELGRLGETALRDLWARIDHAPAPHRDVPSCYLGLVQHLPDDLRRQALARIRASASQSTRLYHLVDFDDELTDAEHSELVETPWNSYTRASPHEQAMHLERVRNHLPRVAVELRRAWLEVMLDLSGGGEQFGLLALLPSLTGDDHRRATEGIVASVLREGCFHTTETRWDLLPDHALAALLLRLKDDVYGWSRDELIEHVFVARDPELADRCLQPILAGLAELAPDSCLEIVGAMTPWLAERSEGAASRALAELPVSEPSRRSNPLYVIARVLAAAKDD